MSRVKSQEKLYEETPIYAINILSAPLPATAFSGCNEKVEQAVLRWFEGRGIRKSNPEELINAHMSLLKVVTREKARKLSAPDERSMLLQRRTKDRISVAV